MTDPTRQPDQGEFGWADGAGPRRRYVGSVLHGLSILDMFTRERTEISVGEMAAELRLHKSSASRLAATLAYAAYLIPTPVQGTYRLGGRLDALGHLTSHAFDLSALVTPHLARLTEASGETGHMAVLEGLHARTESVTDGWHTIRMHSWAGKVSPAHVSSMGKALLAGLSDEELRTRYAGVAMEPMTERTLTDVDGLVENIRSIRENGYGFDDEELEIGMRCVSAPVVNGMGDIVSSISISGPTQRITTAAVPELAGLVRWHAACASRDLGARTGVPEGWPRPPAAEPPALSYLTRRPRPATVGTTRLPTPWSTHV